jgi:NitT/TauT family transport system substrate-binding protein
MTRLNRSFARGSLAVGAALLLSACQLAPGSNAPTAAPPKARTKVTVALGAHVASLFPVTVAAGAGLFEQEGIDAEVVLTGGGGPTLAAVSGGSANFGALPFGDGILATAKGQPIVSVASLSEQYTTDGVINAAKARELGITPELPVADRIGRSKGLRIAVNSRGSGQDKIVRYVPKHYGLDPEKDVTIVTIQNANSSPISDQGISSGGTWWFRPSQGEIPELNGFVYTTLVTRPQFIQENPAATEAVTRAIHRALQMIHADKEGTLKVIKKYLPDVSDDLLRSSLENNLTSYPKSPEITEKGFKQNVDFLAEFGEQANVRFTDVANVEFAKKAAARP